MSRTKVAGMARVWAATENAKVSFVVNILPTAEDLERWRLTASMPALVNASWTVTEER